MQSHKKTTDYIKVQDFTDPDPDRFANTMKQVTKKPFESKMADVTLSQQYRNIWYLKTLKDEEKALREAIAQEIFRLFIPNQPKTRLIQDPRGYQRYIASKEVTGYRALDLLDATFVKEGIKNRKFHGLGEVLVVSLLVNESDLRPANLCLNNNNQIIKIDGDRCFLRLFPALDYVDKNKRQHGITENDLRELPFVDDYTPWNWLDYIEFGERQLEHKLIDAEIRDNAVFRDEVNCAILKVLVLPEQLMKKVIQSITSDVWDARLFYEELVSRRNQLKLAASNNPDFCQYLLNKKSSKDLNEYIEYLKQFKTTGKNDLGMSAHVLDMHEQKAKLTAEVGRISVRWNLRKPKYAGSFFSTSLADAMDVDNFNEVENRGEYKKY